MSTDGNSTPEGIGTAPSPTAQHQSEKIDSLPEWTKFQLPDIPEPDDKEIIDELNQQFDIGVLFEKLRNS